MREMKFEGIAQQLWNPGSAIHVGAISILADGKEYRGRGQIQVDNETAALNVSLAGTEPPPERRSGSYDGDEFWLIAGIVEDEVPFWLKSLPHSSNVRSAREKQVFGCNFSICRVHEIPWSVTSENLLESAARAEAASDKDVIAISAEARLKDFKIVGFNEVTEIQRTNPYLGNAGSRSTLDTQLGSFEQLEYALIQDETDCRVFMRTRKDAEIGAGDLQKAFQFLLEAVAFAHGQAAWPCFQAISGEVEIAWATPGRRTPKGIFPAVNAATCCRHDALNKVIGAYIATMLTGSDFSRAIRELMFLAREASASTVPFNTGLLGLCAVMEETVKTVAKEVLPRDTAAAQAFDDTKKDLKKSLAKLECAATATTGKAAIWRFERMISSANYDRRNETFMELGQHLGIPDDYASAAFKAWKVERNTRAHGNPPELSKDAMINKSRIGGMLNALFLAAIRCNGPMILSPFEDRYFTLK